MEIWKTLDIDERYSISSHGNIVSKVYGKEHLLHPVVDSRGYYYVRIKGKAYNIHRLVAMAFIPTSDKTLHIDHIDGDKLNNTIENLRWVTPSENVLNPITQKRLVIANRGCNNPMYGKKQSLESRIAQSRPVLQFSKDGTFIKEFPAIFLAAEEVGAWKTNITACCKNFNKTAKGFRWKYKEMN